MKINISKKYDNLEVLDNVSFNIEESKITVILGPSGCGKTTLMNCMAKLLPYEGEILPEIDSVSYMFQEDRLLPWFTVYDNLRLVNKNINKINDILTSFHIFDLKDKYPNHISGGEKQRVALARAYLHEHKVLLMDEPFKSLDYELRWKIINEFYTMHKLFKNTVVLITHDIEEAAYLGDNIVILSNKPTKVNKIIKNNIMPEKRKFDENDFGSLLESLKKILLSKY